MRRKLLGVTFVLLSAAPAAAQVLEVGASIGRGCIGDSSGFCGPETDVMWAAHASVWLDDRLEIGFRFATLPLNDSSYVTPRDDRFNAASDPAVRQLPQIQTFIDSRSRQLLGGDVIYHFARGRLVRPHLGVGLGSRIERSTLTCQPSGCEQLMPILGSPVGRHASRSGNLAIVAGLSGRIRKGVLLRGGVRLHNFAGEEASTAELFIAAGYRLFDRR
jgi:hypothetical protein